MHARHKVWCEEHNQKYSNHGDLRNLVEVVEEEVEAGRVEGLDIFFLTDKYVAEAMYYRVNSSDKDIFKLILQFST